MFLSDVLVRKAAIGYIGGKSVFSFQDDLLKLKSIKRQLIIYDKTNKLNIRLFLNNVILFFNVFNTQIGKEIIFEFFDNIEHQRIIKTCLVNLLLMNDYELNTITINELIDNQLKEIIKGTY